MFNPFNLNQKNPFENLELEEICYFDTETTGLHPKTSQIVEIAAIKGSRKFSVKIELTDETKKQIEDQTKSFEPKNKRDKSVDELLKMSGYYENNLNLVSEEKALKMFENFCKESKVLLAHNATFDMKMINERRKLYGLQPLDGIPVYDSLAFSRRFFVPTLITIENTSYSKKSRERAKEILDKLTKQYYKSGQRLNISNNLNALATALRGQIENWHHALADVEALKDLMENFFKLLFDKHYKEDFIKDIRSKPMFKKYYMRNVRFEDRLKQSDKKKKV
jgi:DNA polymerase III epsilon subunit-like protein